MNSLWIFIAVAIVFVALALLIVLPPLFRQRVLAEKVGRRSINIAVYRDQLKEMEADLANGLLTQDQFTTAKEELEARLAQDAIETDEKPVVKSSSGRWLGVLVGLAIPVLAFGLYYHFGAPQLLLDTPVAKAPQTVQDVDAMLKSAEERVKTNPDDINTWAMLARSYTVLERWPEAKRVYENLTRLEPQNASIWSHYAEMIGLANGRNLDGEPMQLIDKALKLDPRDIKALELRGINAYQHQDYPAALRDWEQVVSMSPADSDYAKEMQSTIDQVRQEIGQQAAPAKLDNLADFDKPAAAPGKTVSGTLSLSAALNNQVKPDDMVFIVARAAGQRAPLAALRLRGADLPAKFELSDALSMGGPSLSSQAQVTVIARVSKSGDAMPQPGDLEGQLDSVKVGTSDLKLVIDRVRP